MLPNLLFVRLLLLLFVLSLLFIPPLNELFQLLMPLFSLFLLIYTFVLQNSLLLQLQVAPLLPFFQLL